MESIDIRGGGPIYIRIKERIKSYIISGIYAADEKLPSVRELAVSMSLNPNTVQRAYRELEDEGFIYSVPGKGSFASANSETSEKRKAELLETLLKTVRELRFLGVSADEISSLTERECKDD